MMLSRTLTWVAPALTTLGIITAENAESNQLGTFGAAVAFIAGCATLYKVVLKPGYKMFKKLQKVLDTVERIEKEFSPNGGGSMKDTLNRIEARQMKSEQRQKVLLLDSDDLIYETDANGETTWVNRTYTRITSKGIDELKGSGWISCVHYDDQEKVMETWKTCFAQSRDFDMNFRMVTPDKIINVNSKAHPLVNDRNQVIGYLGQTTILS